MSSTNVSWNGIGDTLKMDESFDDVKILQSNLTWIA